MEQPLTTRNRIRILGVTGAVLHSVWKVVVINNENVNYGQGELFYVKLKKAQYSESIFLNLIKNSGSWSISAC